MTATVAHGVLVRDADRFLIGEKVERSSRGDSEEERLRSMYRAAIVAHLVAALAEHASAESVLKDTERDASRRFLLSPLSPWRADREFICTAAGYDPDVIRARAAAILQPFIERERAAEARHNETAAEREERLSFLHHIALGGDTKPRGGMRRPKSAEDWLKVALAAGDDAALAKAAEMEAAEIAA